MIGAEAHEWTDWCLQLLVKINMEERTQHLAFEMPVLPPTPFLTASDVEEDGFYSWPKAGRNLRKLRCRQSFCNSAVTKNFKDKEF